ncbi:MAG: hypothetical protein ABIP20_21530 [Chthoniobacteraceae bacterium]
MNFLAAALYAVASSVLIGIMLGFQNGALNPQTALVALSGGLVIGGLGWWRGLRVPRLPRPGTWAIVSLVFFAVFACRAFLWLIFRDGDDLRVLSPNNLGDMSLHLTFIGYLKNGAPFWPDSPIFSAGKLTYSIGMDFFNALLALIGVDLVRGLIWTGLLGALATSLALLRWGGAFTVLCVLCNGGLAVLAFFAAAPEASPFQDWQAAWAWKNLALAMLVTQRGFLFALPAGLLLLTSWRTRFFRDGDGWKMPFPGELLLYAAMPIFHIHTFLALSFILGALFVSRTAARAQLARLIATAFIPATALCYLAVGMFKTNAEPRRDDMNQFENPPPRPAVNALGWQPGWMVNDDKTVEIWKSFATTAPVVEHFSAHGKFLIFWFGNFGVLPLLLVPMLVALLRPVLPRGPSQLAAWAIFSGIILITPLLGLWTGYQTKSLGALLSGGTGELDLRAAIAPLLAIVAIVSVFQLRRSNPQNTTLPRVLSVIAGLLILDSLLTVLHAWNPRIPLLPANSVPLLLGTVAFFRFLSRARKSAAGWPTHLGVTALYLFFICCNIRFANWDWDNTKLMIWSWVIVLPALWETILARWAAPWRTLTCTALFFSGFLSLLGGIGSQHRGHAIAQLSTLDAVAQAVRDIPITEAFAAQPTFNHPLLLSGRKLVMGYDGHLASHGILYGPVEDDLDALMRGLPDWRLRAARLGVRYLFFGPGERKTWPASDESWRTGATVIASGEWGEIFDLHTAPLPPPAEEENATPRLAPPRLQLPSAR